MSSTGHCLSRIYQQRNDELRFFVLQVSTFTEVNRPPLTKWYLGVFRAKEWCANVYGIASVFVHTTTWPKVLVPLIKKHYCLNKNNVRQVRAFER